LGNAKCGFTSILPKADGLIKIKIRLSCIIRFLITNFIIIFVTLQQIHYGYFYAVLNSPFSEEEKREIVKSKYLPEESKQALLNMNEDSNPIIMMFK